MKLVIKCAKYINRPIVSGCVPVLRVGVIRFVDMGGEDLEAKGESFKSCGHDSAGVREASLERDGIRWVF